MEVRNRFKGLDLIECPKNYGQRFMTLYRRQGSRPSPRKRNAEKQKQLSEEAIQITVKRKKAKSKGDKERYIHLNAEFQRNAKRDKKAFLSDQCKEIEEKIEWERLETSSRKLEILREHFNPLQCSCLENPRDREAWWAAVSGVAQSRTLLK